MAARCLLYGGRRLHRAWATLREFGRLYAERVMRLLEAVMCVQRLSMEHPGKFILDIVLAVWVAMREGRYSGLTLNSCKTLV